MQTESSTPALPDRETLKSRITDAQQAVWSARSLAAIFADAVAHGLDNVNDPEAALMVLVEHLDRLHGSMDSDLMMAVAS